MKIDKIVQVYFKMVNTYSKPRTRSNCYISAPVHFSMTNFKNEI